MNDRSHSSNPQARQQIVAASHRLFLEQGYNGTSMRQIARESQMALGSLYNHFPGKEDLFSAVFDAFNPYPILLLALENSQGATVDALVRTAARRMVTALSARPDLVKLVFIDVVEFQGRHLQLFYPQAAPRMQRFIKRLQRLSDDLRPIPEANLLRACFGLF
jgi:AcrR family transcriptional regulator